MKYNSNNILCIEVDDLVAAGFVEENIHKGVCVGYSTLPNMKENGRLLFPFDQLGIRYKEAIEKRFGNPYNYMAKAPLRNLIQKDIAAAAFYLEYSFDGTKKLPRQPIDYVTKYTQCASVLNMMIKAETDKKELKKFAGNMVNFYDKMIEIITEDRIDLPTTYITLRRKISDYKANGYASLISSKFGNKNSAKIKDEVSESLLLTYLEHHNQFDDEQVCRFYNLAAVPMGYKAIDQSTVGVHRRKRMAEIMIGRQGNAKFYDTYSTSMKQRRPSCALARLENDDNDLDMYFWKKEVRKGKNFTNYYKRVKMIVVVDALNDYPLGWSYGEEVSVELVRAAWLDAMHHINELTGSWYLPHQIKNDRWALTGLRPFYQSICVDYVDNTLGSKRNRYIEQSFGKKWHKDLKEIALVGYAGHNMSSQTRINPDALNNNLKNVPHISEAPGYISLFIDKIRNRKNEKGQTLTEQWKASFASSEIAQERQISYAHMLDLFGVRHSVASARNPELPNSITKEGVVCRLNNEEYTYDVPDTIRLDYTGANVQVIYSPLDVSRVLVTDYKKLRFIANTTYIMPSAAVDFTENDNKVFWAKMTAKRKLVEWVAEQKAKRQDTLNAAGIDANGLLQAGILTKEIKQEAEAYLQAANGKELAAIENNVQQNDAHFNYQKERANVDFFLD
ncbi:hypothetical protein [Limnovirga soli]|uniref:Transposase n=1 Tax=Limnovirga soli TaxID=2656915 RepID=A0A8J8FAW0_9BACT|nr:hypothetical protein [Limnovirga soli]NNV54566.1 hypothetical protein [Limnovirga soli]